MNSQSTSTLKIISNGTEWAIAKIRPELANPQVFSVYKTKRQALNAFKKAQQMDQTLLNYYADSVVESVMGAYFSGNYKIVEL